jgi:CubicO group peptidase (beta-lactamase class C family)
MAPLTNRRHLLAHTAGLPDLYGPVEDLYDWPSATARLAAQAPQWEPGIAAGYHSLTQGFLVGEVVRRIAGRSLGDFFAQEVAGPLGADFHIGLPAEHDHRVALTVPPPSRDEDYAASAPGSSAPPPPAPVYWSVTGTGRLAPCADPRRERIRQRPLGRPRAVGDGLRRNLKCRRSLLSWQCG